MGLGPARSLTVGGVAVGLPRRSCWQPDRPR